MIKQPNGHEAGPQFNPETDLIVRFDAKRQVAGVIFHNQHFRSWGFVIALLRMGVDEAEAARRQQTIANMQAAALEQEQLENVKQNLRKGIS